MYRDETESMRAELDRTRAELVTTRAELAEIKSEPRDIEVIKWRDGDGVANWVIVTILTLIAIATGCGFASFTLAAHSRIALSAMFATVACVPVALAGYLWFRAIPREKVKR